jgi:hypothetical protein
LNNEDVLATKNIMKYWFFSKNLFYK